MAQTTRTFRIFVSSTFSDLKEERNALQKYAFPRLRDLCTQHGCRFQAIDLRWGVREEAGLDQQTMRICLDEVARSQRTSPRPNFIVLLGDRHGWRPLPAEIPDAEFSLIQPRITNSSDRALLTNWYKHDENAVPPVYCLQPRHGEFADFTTWEGQVERPLRRALLAATEGIQLSEDQRLKYRASATEQEIAAGALSIPDAPEHVFCFFRTISGLPRDRSARDFVDLDEDYNPDTDVTAKLRDLKERLRARLPENIHQYDASWTGSGASSDHIGTLPESLEECIRLLENASAAPCLCLHVWRRLARVILDEIARIESIDALQKEMIDHDAFGESRGRSFIGRAAMLQTIADYVAGSDHHPFAVFGESGSGKSALMARAAQQARARHPNNTFVVRYIGATPASSDGRALLESICREVSRHFGADETNIPTDYKELVKELPQRLALATADKPLILFLDALDQLSEVEHARNLIWLPSELPEHVRLIVSTLPGECLSALEKKLPAANMVKLEPMPRDEGSELLKLWLNDAGRTLQQHQSDEVLNKFADCGLPLYLKLAFEEARRWKSYSPSVGLSADIPGIIRQLFGRLSLDANHGTVAVSRSLGYLAAAKNGVSEDELLDVLSRDKDVLNDFKSRARHTPPEERLPVIVWSRLYFDLEPYLTERTADGASLMSFYHRQLREVVEEEFLAGDEKRTRHARLADYFASQDLFAKEKKTPNVRKLSELPYQQTHGGMWDELHSTLTDFKFLEAKCAHVAVMTAGKPPDVRKVYGGVYELQEDYRQALENWETEPPGTPRTRASPKRPIIVTAWVSPTDQSHAIGCPLCRVWSVVSASALGTAVSCPHCQGPLKLNPFTLNADWRPVAEAWQRGQGMTGR